MAAALLLSTASEPTCVCRARHCFASDVKWKMSQPDKRVEKKRGWTSHPTQRPNKKKWLQKRRPGERDREASEAHRGKSMCWMEPKLTRRQGPSGSVYFPMATRQTKQSLKSSPLPIYKYIVRAQITLGVLRASYGVVLTLAVALGPPLGLFNKFDIYVFIEKIQTDFSKMPIMLIESNWRKNSYSIFDSMLTYFSSAHINFGALF